MAELTIRSALRVPEGRVSVRDRAGVVAGSAISVRDLLAAARPEVELGFDPSWSTWIGTERVTRLLTAMPQSLEELLAVVDHAVANEIPLQVPASGHSTSAVARPDRMRVLIRQEGAEPARWLRSGVDAAHHLTVHSATWVKRLNRIWLDDLGMALPNMGSFDGQTLAGAITTGTHGSSIHTGPMAESVRSVDLVVVEDRGDGPRACAYRIEPTDGITEPAAFAAARADHGLELIQDDDLFYSVVVSFNAVGVIYRMTLEVVHSFWLQEENSALRWSELKTMLEPEAAPGFDDPVPPLLVENDFVEFLVNSAEVQPDPGDPMCLLRRRNRVEALSRPSGWQAPWPPRRTPPAIDQLLTEAVVRPRIDNRTGAVLGIVDIGDQIANTFQTWGDEAPFDGGLDCSISHLVLRRERDDSDLKDAPQPPPEAISNEIAVPLAETVRAVDDVLTVMSDSDDFYAVPFGVRFVGASRHFLAPQHGRLTTMIETPMLLPSRRRRRARDLPRFEAALERIEEALCYATGAVGGRPHWGQYHTIGPARLAALGYPDLPRFRAVRERFNAGGIFTNRHTRQLGLG